MAYGHSMKKRNSKKTRKMESRALLASLAMAAGIFAYPLSIGEAEIVKKDGSAVSTDANNVYNIEPEKEVDSNFAYNRFEKFDLAANQIANLKFGNAIANEALLANLVSNQVSINGIVNAVKDGKIDGHLMFLSPNGIAVGASGVINAGQFTGIVPTQTAFDTLYNANNITLDAVTALQTGSYANDKKIEINGQINTHSGIMLGAGIININEGAKLQSTKDVQFSDVVNTGSPEIAFATSGTGGDIILTAKQESTVNDDTAIRWRDRSTDLAAAVNIGKNVTIASSDGAVKHTATSTSNYTDSTPMTLTDTLKDMIFGEDSALEGTIGKLTGQEAGANKYLFVNYSNKRNKSSVNIGENSNITGNNIEIAATSKVNITQSVAVPGGANPTDSNSQAVSGNSAAVAAVTISRIYNTADVVIDGNLTAAGADGIKIAANADTNASLSATGYNANNTSVVAGVAILTGDTKAKVTMNAPASATQGKVSVDAVTKSDIDVNADAVGNAGYAVSNVGVANYDTSADVIINRSITAGAVDVNAENDIAGLKMTVGNMANETQGKDTAGANAGDDADANEEKAKAKTEDEQKSGQKSIDPAKVTQEAFADTTNDEKTNDAKDGVQKVKDKVIGTNESGTNAGQTSAFGRGAAVGVVSNKNDANVTLGKDAVITTAKVSDAVDGSVHVNAAALMNGQDSLRLSVQNRQSGSNAEIGAAVLVSNVENNATVLLDNEGDQSAQISGAGAVSLNASAGMGKYEDGAGKEQTNALAYAVGAANQSEGYPSGSSLSGSVGVNTLKNDAVVLLGQKSKVAGTDVKLSSNATTSAAGTYGATDENAKVGVGATVGLQNISGNSLVMAGKGAELTGASKVTVSANNTVDLKNNVQNAGMGDSFGISGMAALSCGDSNSVVSLDDEAVIQAPTVRLTSMNSTNVDNSARSQSVGRESSKALGIGVGIVNYDVNNLAMVGDNGNGMSAPAEGTTDEQKAAQKIYEDAALARDIAGDTLAGKLGAATTDGAKGSITTERLAVSAITTGLLENDAKAKAVSSAITDTNENVNERKDSEKWGQWSKKGTEGAKEAKANTENLEQDKVASQNDGAAPNASQSAQEAGNAANPDGAKKAAFFAAAPFGSAGASILAEGSAALTFLGGRTDAVLDNVTVKNAANNEAADVKSVSLAATDILGSVTFGGTDAKNTLRSDSSATKVGIGGTFAMNDSARDVDALLRNSNIQQAQSVSNSATKTGIEAAAGMGVSASRGNGTNIFGAGVVYYNRAKQDIHALMIDNTVTGASDGTGTLTNKAKGTDFQIAGGLAASFADGSSANVGAGGAVAVSNLENNLSAGIIGGSYQDFRSVNVETQKKTAQLNGALAATYAGGDSGYGFEGAFAYTDAKNTTHAYISGATIGGTQASAVNVKAGEGSVLKTEAERQAEKDAINSDENFDADTKSLLKDAADADKKNKELLEGKGIDTTGKSYLDTTAATSALGGNSGDTDGGKAAGEAARDENTAKRELDANRSFTVTAAMAGGWNGKAGVGAGIAYNYVKNDVAADIKNSVIQADAINGEAAGESLIVSVGAGVAVGGKAFNGAGSGSWNDIKNDTKVTFANNTLTGKTVSEKAESVATILNIAGEVAGGQGMALGLSLAYNSLNNTTGTYLTGNTINLSDAASLELAATNESKTLAVAGGVDVSAVSGSFANAVGTVAINRGLSNTESVVDGKKDGDSVANTKIDNVKTLSVTAQDSTQKTAVAGGVSVGSAKVGVGGAVAYTAIGSADSKEKLRAEINHADITTADDGTVKVSAADNSGVTTVGAGIGVSWGKNPLNLQGAAAVSEIHKDSRAALNNTNINAGDAAKHPTINVTADTKSKIDTVGVVGDISVGDFAAGTVGLAINRMNQDTAAEMATDDGKTTKSNVGLTQVRATGDGDIHSVGVGGTVAVNGKVSFAGSGSYNYIGNDVNAIIKNQNLTSSGSVGAVTRSDDHIYNFSGALSVGANAKAALGAAVAINEITGSTNALVQGGSLLASGTDSITVTRPQDGNLFTTENIELSTDRENLSANRKNETKTGVVVDSSATHTIISQMASGGVAASSDAGVGLAGTVNLNTVKGKTTAKIKDAALNSSEQYADAQGGASAGAGAGSAVLAPADVNVNAIDYTNLGSFTGTASVGAAGTAGVSLGVSANWETLGRTTAAEITAASEKKNVYAKNLTVDATAKHGSSALAFAVAVGAGGDAGVASGDSIVRRENTSETSAKLDNVNAVFDGGAEIKVSHLGNSNTMNIGGSVSGGYGTAAAGAGVSVMDDASTVKAEVKDSDLQAKASENGKNISVLAENENHWKNTLVTASAAVGIGAGLAANVGVSSTTSETSALVTNSNLKANDVTVKASDTLTADSTGGVGVAGLAGVGVSIALNNVSSGVSARVTGGTLEAANNAALAAEETRGVKSSVTGVAVGGVGAGINVAVTSINKSITNAQLSSAADEDGKSMGADKATKDEIKVHLDSVNNAKGALGAKNATFYGLSASDKQDLEAAKNQKTDLSVPDAAAKKRGVHAEVGGNASVTAGENVNLTAKETSDISANNTEVAVGGSVAASVTDAIIHVNHDTDVTLDKAAVTGKTVSIEASQTQTGDGSKAAVNAVGVGSVGVGVGYAGVVNKGATDVNITDSAIESTGNITVNAKDESKGSAKIANTGVSLAQASFTFANVENAGNVGVTLAGKNEITAAESIAIDAKKANALEAHTEGVGVSGADVAVNHATVEDKGTAAAKITGKNNTFGTFTAKTFHLGAANDATGKLSAGNTTVSILGVSRMRGKGVMDLGAEVDVAGGAFNAKQVEFVSQLGDANGRTLEGNVKGQNVSGVAVDPDAVVLDTDAASKVVVANSSFASDADLVLNSKSYVDRKAHISGVTVGTVAVGNTSADVSGTETLTAALKGKSGQTTALNSLRISAYGENKGKALADAGGGGLVDYVGAHVGNTSTSTVESSIGGKWDIKDYVSLSATHRDETRLTASEGHGEVAGLSGTSADNVINTNTKATVEKGADITGNRFQASTMNAVVTGAYDDTDDARSYTLEDYFGGIISGNSLRSLLDVTENGSVSIGENAKITTSNQQEYVASSMNDLTNHVQTKGGGAAVETDAVGENKLNINNTVDVQRDATLSSEKEASKEDIILSAYDNQSLKSHTDATVYAFAGYSLAAKNKTTMNRTSNVNVAGTIDSGSDVGLYAGYDAYGVKSNLKADLKAGAYNYSAIPITSPDVDYTIAADKGTVDVSGTVRSTGDINAVASGGREEIAKDESKWEWTIGGSSTDKKFLSSNAVVERESSDKMKESTVHVTGALIAGTADPINLTIKGAVAEGIEIETDANLTNRKVKEGITKGTFDYASTLGERLDELNQLIAAYDAEGEEGDENAGKNAGKMAAYVVERERIKTRMAELGLTETDKDGNVVYISSGLPVFYVDIPDIATSGGNINVQANNLTGTGELRANAAPDVTITNESDAYLRLNNILMGEQGGQIVYNADNVIPPNVLQGNAKINEINVEKGKAAFSKIYGETDGKPSELLVDNTFKGEKKSTVKLTPELEKEIKASEDLTEAEKQKYIEEIKNGSFQYTAVTDVEVNGTISNACGNVTIKNETKFGNIRINGGTQERPTGISGANVTLIANGAIVQDYKEGIVHISGAPEDYLEDVAKELQEELKKNGFDETSQSDATQLKEYSRDGSTVPTGYIAGSDIYVSAANINVNGLIQSGYKTYAATVTQEQLDKAKESPADRAAVVQNRTMYKVNDGGIKWSSDDDAFYYEAQVYWDPSANHLVVEDIETTGGKVYLTGRIASTYGIFEDPIGPIVVHGQVINDSDRSGSAYGRILVADGAANINLKNETALDMNVGKILNNQREGVITIADTAKNTWTEYRRGQTRSIADYAKYLGEHASVEGDIYKDAETSVNDLAYDNTLTYEVQDGQVYTWVNGKNVQSTKTYETTKKYAAWGLIETSDDTELTELSTDENLIDENDRKDMGLPEGAVLTTDEVTNPDGGVSDLEWPDDLTLHGSTKLLSEKVYDKETYTKKSGFLGWNKKKVTRWKYDATTLVLYKYLLTASEDIGIGLLGDEKGSITIDSVGNVNLTGNVANSHNEAVLTVGSTAGGITQFDNTTLRSEIVNLTAQDDITGVHIASLGSKDENGNVTDNIQLSAVSNGKGNIDVTAVGGVLGDQFLPGNVEIVALKSQDGSNAFNKDVNKDVTLGNVTLNAEGNITQSGSGVTVEGWGINLTSVNGGIGTAEQSVQIASPDAVTSQDRYGAQVNASAKGDVYLAEAAVGGDMRVGKIVSKEGDVNLTVTDGAFIDALSNTSGSTESVDSMVHRWIDAGLIDGEKRADGSYTYKGAYITGLEKSLADYRANVELAYTGKTKDQWAAEYAEQKTAVEKVYASADYRNYIAGTDAYAGLTDAQKAEKLAKDGHKNYVAYARYDSADAYLKDTAAYKYSQYDNANDYLASDAAYKALADKAKNPTFEWTKDMMLYAVREKLVNKNSGDSDQTEREASVFGKNINLTAAKGVGTFDIEPTTITVDDLAGADSVAYMKQLMNADAADVTVHRDENGNVASFEIVGNMPLGVKLQEGGTLNVQAGGTVSVAGRTDAEGENSAINVGTIDATQNGATGDVRLFSEKGIYNARNDDQPNITGRHLSLIGGEESIGTSDKPLAVSLSGDLVEARAEENVFIKNVKNDDFLRLGTMFAKDTISVESEMGFLMSDAYSEIADSYINAGKTLEFKTNAETGIVGGVVDNEDHAIRILNDRAVVNIAAKSADIMGVGSLTEDIRNGTLVLGDIDIKDDFSVGSEGKIAQTDTGKIVAKDVTAKSGESLILENTGNQFNSITVDGIETETGEKPEISGDVRIQDNADALTVAFNRGVAGDVSVKNLREDGTLVSNGNITATGNISLGSKGNLSQAADTVLSAGKEVDLASTAGSITQDTTAGIQAKNVATVSAKGVDLQGEKNAFDALTVESADVNAPLRGSVSVKDKADKLELSVQPVVNGDITAENAKENGVLHVVSEELRANGNETDGAKGSISLKSDGSLQTDAKLTAEDDVNLTSVSGDVSINNNIYTGRTNALVIHAGGAVTEAAGATIAAPVVEAYSGKGVSLESEYNQFADFRADVEGGIGAIDGGVKAVTRYAGGENEPFKVSIGASVNGDAEFTNRHKNGGLELLIWNHDAAVDKDKIEILGGNGADGNLVLNAGGDVKLLGNTEAAHDIVVNSANGSFSGIGKSMKAGHDVLVSAGDAVTYVGTINAGNDMDIRVTNPSSDGRGIRIGELNENETLLAAGNEARFYVQGDGNIHFAGDVIAEKGDVIADISGTGNIEIYNSVESGNDSVSLRTGKGDIVIGADNTHNEETIKAKNNVTVETGTGTITIQGKTSTQVGDITMKAGKDSYQAGVANGNFIIRDDGKMISGGGIALNGRNGDIEITDDMQAEKSITVNIAEEGNASFGRDVTVTNDVNISTDKGSITVGQTVNADEGTVSLSTGSGNISIGKDVTAGKDVAVSSRQGNITVGHTETGDDGDILSKAGNVSIGTGAGDVQIVKTVTAEEGSIGISSGQGDILIGDNGPDVKTVTAKQDIDLTAQDGRIVVYGKTSTEEGDISLSAHRKETIPGEDNSTFVIDQNGKLEAGRSIRLDVEGGDLHVSDRIQAKEDLTTELSGKGSVYFDKDVNVNGNVTVRTDEGDIKVGHEVLAVKDINMTTNTGDVDIGSAVKSTGGSIGIHLGTGNVNIGDNGPNVDTVTAKENIDIGTYTGKIYIYGKTSTQAGDISLSAGNRQYTPGSQSIIIDLNGMVDSGRDVRLAGRNGDLHVTDAIRVKRDLYAQVFEEGGVYFDRKTAVTGDLTLAGDVIVADRITADNGGKVFRFSAAGAFPKRVIDYFRVGSLNSEGGTEMPSLWTKHGYLHVDKGDIAVDDAFAVDKIYLENDKTNVAIFGRIPTRDGEQLVYWNNLDMADSKKRSFQLYTDGTLRTHGAVLIDAEGNYGKLYGDNLSVVDMMRDRVSHERGKYTFDSALLTEPGRLMREPVFFGVESTDVIIQQQNASDAEIVVE